MVTNMIFRVIISHHQTEFIHHFPSNNVTMVFDDITSEDIDKCKECQFNYTKSDLIGNRSKNRNVGVKYLSEHYNLSDDDIIEFFDGDRYPIKYNIFSAIDLMTRHDLSVMLYTCQSDSRNDLYKIPETGALEVDTGILSNPFYSCGFAMKVSAIESVMKINKAHTLFNEEFTKWGIEDQYLGIQCHALGLKAAITKEVELNGKVGGDCEEHKDYLRSLEQYLITIQKNNFEIRMRPRESVILD